MNKDERLTLISTTKTVLLVVVHAGLVDGFLDKVN